MNSFNFKRLCLVTTVLISGLGYADSVDVGFVGISVHSMMNKNGWNFTKRKVTKFGNTVWNPELNVTFEHKNWLLNTTYLKDCQGFDAYYLGAGYRWNISDSFSASLIVGILYQRLAMFNTASGELTSNSYKFIPAPMISLQKDFKISNRFSLFVNASSNYVLTHAFMGLKVNL